MKWIIMLPKCHEHKDIPHVWGLQQTIMDHACTYLNNQWQQEQRILSMQKCAQIEFYS
jgi:hypothetical protein